MTTTMANAIPLEVPVEDLTAETAAEALAWLAARQSGVLAFTLHWEHDRVRRSELRAGSGAKPKANSKVQVRYVGRLADGSVFDQSETPQWFRLDSVISGWRVALQEMPVGAKWRLVIPSAQAYGAEGAGDLIAPYTPLVFEVELLGTAD